MRYKSLSVVTVLLALALAASAASIPPTGTLSFGQGANGGVIVSATRVDWYLPLSDTVGAPTSTIVNGGGNTYPNNVNPGATSPPNNGAIVVGGSTDITYDGGTYTSGTGSILDLDVTTGPAPPNVPGFITLTGTDLTFTLNNFNPPGTGGPGQPVAGCSSISGPAEAGESCRPMITYNSPAGSYLSPVVLTQNADGSVSVSLTVTMTGNDAQGSAPWSGTFTTQVPNVPGLGSAAAIEAEINLGNAINDTYSGGFSGFSLTVPEPATGALIGCALIGLAALLRRRKA
jgi:hypothetical protein